ncbi:MAG TPA: peptidoglycan-associated lipoprotein Pal [Candidatus Bathyarchaeia archaeon]|nr:peptidoglycan-associated lipoprotein Pal [Candidatus Bathyarchaeia archaeon]
MKRVVRTAPVVIGMLALAVLVSGCPKRPGTAMTSAPAPSGSANAGQTGLVPATTTAPSRGATPPAPAEFAATDRLADIHFEFDKYDIRPEDAKILDADAAWLKTRPDELLLIEGHCDERGTVEYNLALGERRAKAAMNYLVGQGVQARRITLISYGKERPVCTTHDEACWAMDRRAHFLVKAR